MSPTENGAKLLSMPTLLSAIDEAHEASQEFDEETTTAVTKVEAVGMIGPRSYRRSGDGQVERVDLERPPGSCAVCFTGLAAMSEANLMLDAWARSLPRTADHTVRFTVRFGDGLAYRGIITIQRKRDRNLISHLKREENFRAAFCPNLLASEARAMFALFLTSYEFDGAKTGGRSRPSPMGALEQVSA